MSASAAPPEEGQQANEALYGFDALAWQIEQEYTAKMDGIIDMHASSLDPNLAISSRDTEHLHMPESGSRRHR